jgi:hypothetical protein
MTSHRQSTPSQQPASKSQNNPLKRKLFFEPTWNDHYVQLAVFKAKYGHCLVPSDYTEVEGLADWVIEQRRYFNARCKYTDSDKDRVRALNVLDFDFQVSQDSWEKNCRALKLHLEENSGQWPKHHFAHHQRVAYAQLVKEQEQDEPFRDCPPLPSIALSRKQHPYNNPRPPRLSTARIQMFEDLGMLWKKGKSMTPWETRFRELAQFKEDNGHTIVPQHYQPNRYLGEWVTRMRYQYGLRKKGKKNNQLTDERVRMLNGLGFQWSASGAKTTSGSPRDDDDDDDEEEVEEDDDNVSL